MAFEGLADRLQNTIKKITGKGKVSEKDVNEMAREVRLALLEADVNFRVVRDFIDKVKERAVGQEVMESLTPGQQVVKVVKEELTELMGGEHSKIAVADRSPTVIMMVGLQGAGKTTTTGKLANLLRKDHNRSPLLVACDVYRPAAVDQLQRLGKQLDMPVFDMGTEAKPVEIAEKAIEYTKEEHRDYVIIDTAGRLHVDSGLMDELTKIYEVTKADEIFLVVDAIFLISTFFITSADSATFVVGMQTTDGMLNPPLSIKLTWGIIQAAAAAVLLWSGGLEALQTAAIISAFPFVFILLFMMISIRRVLEEDYRKSHRQRAYH